MKLRRLELLGFKSFCEKTVFVFDDGITSIVGPNGCGKSNIVDAILWVLGERGTRTLRVRDMEDVIFHGSDGRKGVGIAEVTLYLSDDSEEYTVRRRIFKDGTNEYFLNGKPVRLKDIQELFLGKGIGVNSYAIIEQGKIESFIQMKPRDRKLLIEEAGGVTRFKEKKEEALIRLEEVKNNLQRVEDLKREVEVTLKRAEIEYERWRKYRELSEKKREIEIKILACGLEKLNAVLEKLQKRCNSREAELERIEEEKRSLEELLKAKDDEISLIDRTIRDLELGLKSDEKEIEANLKELERLRERKNELKKASEDAEKKLRSLVERLNTTEREIENLYESLHRLESLMEKRISRIRELKDLVKQKEEKVLITEEEYEAKRNELFYFVSNLSEKKNKILDLERRKGEIEKRRKRYEEEKSFLESKVLELTKKVERLNQEIHSKRKELELLDREKEEWEKKYEAFSSEAAKIEAILNFLQEEKKSRDTHRQKFGSSKESERTQSSRKQLIELIRVERDSEWILKRCFARELSFFVVEDEIEDVIENLPDDGNYVFFTEGGLFIREGNGVRLNLKHVPQKKEALRRIKEGEEGIFVCEDSVLDSRGFLLKKGYDEGLNLELEMEKRRLERELREIEEKIKAVSADLKEKTEKKKQIEQHLLAIRRKRDEVYKDVEKLSREVAVTEAMIKESNERLYKLPEVSDADYDPEFCRLDELKRELDLLTVKRGSMEEELKCIHQELLKEKTSLKGLDQKVKQEETDLQKLKADYDRLKVEVEKKSNYLLLMRDEENSLREKMLRVDEERKNIDSEIERLNESYTLRKEKVESMGKKVEELKMKLGSLHEERFEISNRIKNLELRRENLRTRLEELKREILLENERRERLIGVLRNTYSVDVEDIDAGDEEIESLERKKVSLEDEIAKLGEINFRAEKDYEEILSRFQFLEREREDLDRAVESLKKTIDRVDSLSQEIFFETLSKVNQSYGGYVNKLFGGGEGYLSFNKAIDGVEMYVKPKGKKVTTLEMLSGGEKALASASFLFALISTNPPPFCLMDEIDAPLDDASLSSLLDVVKELSKGIQIIFITHNRLTMEASGTIYGITMEEDGVSKVVSVRLAKDSLKK